jgi:WD40 repeat protein
MQSDFYVSPLDWSRSNRIAFALLDEVIFINPKTMEITTAPNMPCDVVSLKFSSVEDAIFLGCNSGDCVTYDVAVGRTISEMSLFETSALVADWRDQVIVAGSRDGQVAIIDVRENDCAATIYEAHPEEVCAIRLHPEEPLLATSGNECAVKIWDLRKPDTEKPLMVYGEHEAAVRAVAWSPNARDLIVTGGGTDDKCIRLWNIDTGETLKSVDSGSQVCNLYWNLEYNEIVSSHGYSQNHIGLWKGTDLSPISQFYQHKKRVLYMCASPDGSTIATAAAEDSFQVWKMFPSRSTPPSQSLLLLR